MHPLRKWWTITFGGHVTATADVALTFEALSDGSVRVIVNTANDLGYKQNCEFVYDQGERDQLWELLAKARANQQGVMSTSRVGRTFRPDKGD